MTKNLNSPAPNGKKAKILVGIVMGSISDAPIVEETEKVLMKLGIPYDKAVASAHRTPDLVRSFITNCEKDGAQVFIAAAGGAAALPGVVAAETIKPVIGVPIESVINGIDSLLSIAQMPGGVPVATVAIGKAGAKNAGFLAAEILAVSMPEVADAMHNYRKEQREKILKDNGKLKTNTPNT
jgi:5-(carboxyamino)imidazole ribonucleotide mutase